MSAPPPPPDHLATPPNWWSDADISPATKRRLERNHTQEHAWYADEMSAYAVLSDEHDVDPTTSLQGHAISRSSSRISFLPSAETQDSHIESVSALISKTRGEGNTPGSVDGEAGNGEGNARRLSRGHLRPLLRSRSALHGLAQPVGRMMPDSLVADRDWRAGKSGGYAVGEAEKADRERESRRRSKAGDSDARTWVKGLPSMRRRTVAPRLPGDLPLPSSDHHGLVASRRQDQDSTQKRTRSLPPQTQTTETPSVASRGQDRDGTQEPTRPPSPETQTSETPSEVSTNVANASTPSPAGLDYDSALTRLASALCSFDTAGMRDVLPPVDILLATLAPDLLCRGEMVIINSTANQDPDIGIGGYCVRVRRLINTLGRDLKGEAEGPVQVGLALALQTRSLPEQAVRELVVRPGALHNGPVGFAEREQDGEQRNDENVARFCDFVLASNAYATFKTNLMAFAHKPYWAGMEKAVGNRAIGEAGKMLHPEDLKIVVEELSWVPSHLMTFTDYASFPLPPADRLKAFVEDHTHGEGDWWPLSPRKHSLQEGFCRLQWRSPCGAPHHLDVPQDARERLHAAFGSAPAFLDPVPVPSAEFMEQLTDGSETSKTPPANRVCLLLQRLFGKWTSPQIVHSSVALQISLKQALPGPSPAVAVVNADQYSAKPQSATVENSPQSQQSPRRPSKTSIQPDDLLGVHPASVGNQNNGNIDKHHHIYLCIESDPLRVIDIDCDESQTDSAFFEKLKSKYKEARGFMRRWLSVWQYDHCKFYEFCNYDINLASPTDVGFPDAKDHSYDFEPRPPHRLPPHGPVSQREFKDRYYRPNAAPRAFWTTWRPRRSSGGKADVEKGEQVQAGNAVLEALPKKKTALAMDDGVREDFFGLLAVDVFSYSWAAVYVVLAQMPWIAFFLVWIYALKHPVDLQNAAVPITVSLTLTGILIAVLVKKG